MVYPIFASPWTSIFPGSDLLDKVCSIVILKLLFNSPSIKIVTNTAPTQEHMNVLISPAPTHWQNAIGFSV